MPNPQNPSSTSNWITTPDYIIVNISRASLVSDFARILQYHGELDHSNQYHGQKYFNRVQDSAHFKYLLNYLFLDEKGLQVKSVIIERSYTSLSYLADFVNYYAKTYYPYIKDCSRIHFFAISNLTKEKVEQYIYEPVIEGQEKSIWLREVESGYKGHIVIKKLPKGSIGASLLAPYESEDKDGITRFYKAVRPYSISLFGKELNINTMPYQEQDSVIGYCATSALWFAFQITSNLFHTLVPSPSDITLSAGHDSNHTGKNFPRNGLELSQVCQAIYSTGLVAELRASPGGFMLDNNYLKGFVYAYLRMGLPVLLGVEIDSKGDHLVTINGYRVDPELEIDHQDSKYQIDLVSDKITRFYAHDDQIGPFARMEFVSSKLGSNFQFETSWWRSLKGPDEKLGADAKSVIVPIIDEIKVIYENILYECVINKFIIETYIVNLKLTWDLYICKSNDYKKDLLIEIANAGVEFDGFEKAYQVFTKSLPQYIWVAKGYEINGPSTHLIFDFIYDATDVNFSRSPFLVNIYDEDFYDNVAGCRIDELLMLFNLRERIKGERGELENLVGETKDVDQEINSQYDESDKSLNEEVSSKSFNNLDEKSKTKTERKKLKSKIKAPQNRRAAKKVVEKKDKITKSFYDAIPNKTKGKKKVR